MPSDDLTQHATSEYDFYEILGVTFETSEADIRRAYRRTALKYHPDKNVGNVAAVEKFHLLQIAYDVLTDPAVKAAYDNARAARVAKRRQMELFDGKRRQMMDDLERRERGVKRGRDEDVDAEEKLRREVARLAEDGKRRRKEREEMLRRQRQEEEEEEMETRKRRSGMNVVVDDRPLASADGSPDGAMGVQGNDVSEIDRTIKVRWTREGAGQSIDKDQLVTLFSRFGLIDGIFFLKDKKQRIGDAVKEEEGERRNKKEKKKVVATGVIQYTSIVGAHAAVEDFPKQKGGEWTIFDSVFWASNQEPQFSLPQFPSPLPSASSETPNSPSPAATRTHPQSHSSSFHPLNKDPSTSPLPSSSTSKDNHRTSNGYAIPTFTFLPSKSTSSDPVRLSTTTTTNGDGDGVSDNGLMKQKVINPTLEEMTLIRLKNAEKKRLEEEIRRREAEEDRLEREHLEGGSKSSSSDSSGSGSNGMESGNGRDAEV